jgi:spermidine synthase
MVSLHAALFLSGSAALIYESTWGRMLHRVFGVGDQAIATVLAAFFLGLGIGSALGGRFAERTKRPALAYVLLEVGIAIWAVLSLAVIPNVHALYASLGQGASFETLTVIRLLLALLILLPPTTLMGATLPILVKVVSRAGGDWTGSATALYATNTFGAMFGAAITGLYLLPAIGINASVIAAAGGSLAAAVVVLGVFRPVGPTQAPAPAPEPVAEEVVAMQGPTGVRLAVFFAATAGFASLAGEVLWTRVLRIVVQGTTPAFAAMLANYLFGIAVGSLIARRLVKRYPIPTRLFGWSQILLACLTFGALLLAPHTPRILGLLQGEPNLEPHDVGVVLGLAAILLLPLSLALGTSVPLAWAIAGGGSADAPSHTGQILAANTLGGLLGSLLAGFVLVPAIGTDGALVLVLMVHLFLGVGANLADGLWTARVNRSAGLVRVAIAGLAGGTMLGGVMATEPSVDLPFLLHARNDPYNAIISGPSSSWEKNALYLREGRNTTVTIIQKDDLLRLYNDGRPESGFGGGEPGFGSELGALGALPGIYAGHRDRAMVVGLGAGHTTTMLLAGGFARIDVVELEEAIVEAARDLHRRRSKPFPLDDARAHLVVDDARAQLALADPDSYDAVVSQPSHPWLAGSSALYTVEFFHEVKRALREDGVFALWVNLFRTEIRHLRSVARTLLEVFPYAQAYVVEDSSFILCASETPMQLDDRAAERIRGDGFEPFLDPLGLDDIIDVAAVRELDTDGLQVFAGRGVVLDDDRPVLEYALAGTPHDRSVRYRDLDRALMHLPWISTESFLAFPDRDEVEIVLARLQEINARPNAIARLELTLAEAPLEETERRYIDGALAEARGNLRGALEGYDASGLRASAQAADELRLAERMFRQAVQRALGRPTVPWSAEALMTSTIALGDPAFAPDVLRIAEQANDPADAPLVAFVRAWAEGCDALLAASVTDEVAAENEHAAFAAERCAMQANDLRRAASFAEFRARERRSTARSAGDDGDKARGGGNDSAAIRFYRRALAANPGHGAAAAALAELLDGRGDHEEAERVLRESLPNAEGMPTATDAIRAAARRLMVTLPDAD